MYTVNALMHQTMSPVELYDMNSSQMEEPLSYYFKIDLRTPIGKPVVVRRYKSPEIKLFSKVKNRVPLLAHLRGVTSVTSFTLFLQWPKDLSSFSSKQHYPRRVSLGTLHPARSERGRVRLWKKRKRQYVSKKSTDD